MTLPLSRCDVVASCVWLYVAYRVHTVARYRGRPFTMVEMQRSVRAVVRSVSCRSRPGRVVIFGIPGRLGH